MACIGQRCLGIGIVENRSRRGEAIEVGRKGGCAVSHADTIGAQGIDRNDDQVPPRHITVTRNHCNPNERGRKTGQRKDFDVAGIHRSNIPQWTPNVIV